MNAPSLLPFPRSFVEREDTCALTSSAAIAWQGPDTARGVAELLAEYLRAATGLALPVRQGPAEITLVQTADPAPDAAGLLPEAYSIDISAAGIRLEATSAAGLARAIQTLRQLAGDGGTFPACRIEDAPAFRWRGLHLDVSRHFFPVEDVERFIELLAQHRLNVFHWHLTDDQGWRIEIRKYPRLTEVGSIRAETLVGHHGLWPHRFNGTPHGGFYTQEDIRRVVAFAARRHVTIVPEIDMPGHMSAAIAAYPELGNGFVARPEVRRTWGIAQNILSLDDACVAFCEDIWREVFDLFPGVFCHLGGDEAPTKEWEESDAAQALMAARGLSSPRQMQSWFTARMDAFFRAHGKRLIGWDEILEGGGIDPSAAVMHWRTHHGHVDIAGAAKAGHLIVRAPVSHTYLDYYQAEPTSEEPLAIGGLLTLPHVYGFDPCDGIAPEARGAVLGGQAQLWTEYIATRDHLDYMAYPRACALAEALWAGANRPTYADFHARLTTHAARLRAQGVHLCEKSL